MKKMYLSLPLAGLLLLSGCGSDEATSQVISKRYIHKYGYAVSKEEWDGNNYPGQVLTTLRNGVTINANYENGVLHGVTTHTHPHSQTVQYFYLYNFGDLKKEVEYDNLGMPVKEKVQLSPHRYCVTMWYGDGTPLSVEDFAGDELLDGQYFTLNNDLESKVERGNGICTRHDQHGVLLSKDTINAGYMTKRESFYPSGSPESITHYSMNKRNGLRESFTEAGDPVAVEEWVNDQLHGKATYFVNGKKQTELYLINGLRNGIETHFIDGEHIEQEILWINDKRHGQTKFYVNDALARSEWYYNNKLVSRKRYDELDQVDKMVTQASTEFRETINR